MDSGKELYIWQADDWPKWRYDLSVLTGPLTDVGRAQGVLLGRLADVGLALRAQASLAALTQDVVKTSEIEGEVLNVESVRSSIARRLGVDIGAVAPVDRHVEGVVEMVLDATSRSAEPLTAERLFGWHAALFPTGYTGMNKLTVGQWRDDAAGPMQVVSGPVGRRKVHFQAPPADALSVETAKFLSWANEDTGEPALVKAGLAHLWFVTLHPFDDGNGRIGNFVEIKKSTIGDRSKVSHLGYVGDCEMGEDVNFGCGAITVNYDGFEKHTTIIGKGVMVGSNVNLIAPLIIDDGAFIAAGSTITQNVPADALSLSRAKEEVRKGWAATYRQRKAERKKK